MGLPRCQKHHVWGLNDHIWSWGCGLANPKTQWGAKYVWSTFVWSSKTISCNGSILLYICICICICKCICAYAHVCIYIYACVYICKYLYICIYIYVNVYIYICIYMYICICVYVYMCMYIYICAYIYIWLYVVYVYMYLCIYVFNVYVYIYMYICMWQWPLGSISFVGLERHLLQSNERYSKHLYNRARLSEALDVDRRQ